MKLCKRCSLFSLLQATYIRAWSQNSTTDRFRFPQSLRMQMQQGLTALLMLSLEERQTRAISVRKSCKPWGGDTVCMRRDLGTSHPYVGSHINF